MSCFLDMPILLEQTTNRGEWAVSSLQTGIFCKLPLSHKYHPLYRRLITILCIAGLQREPSGFQAADHGGDGSHQGREEAEGPGSSVFLGKEEIEAKFHPSG